MLKAKNILAVLAFGLIGLNSSAAGAFIELSTFGSSVEGDAWTWTPATSTISGSDAGGALLFPSSFSPVDFTTLNNYAGKPANLLLTLTGFVTTSPGGAFTISLEDGLGNVSATPFLWSAFTTTSSTATVRVNPVSGFQWNNVVAWTLDAGGTGNAVNATFTKLSITSYAEPPLPPVITSATTATGQVGSPFKYKIDANNSPTFFRAIGLPIGLTVDNSTGLISGTPTVAATSSITISVTNAGGTATATLTLRVAAAQRPTVNVTPTALKGFTTKRGKASKSSSFTVSGSKLTTQVTVRAPAGYQISRSATKGYTSSLKVAGKSGTLSPTTIHVRLAADKKAKVGNRNGKLTISSTGASARSVSLTGKITK